MLAAGYLWALIRRKERPVSPELLAFTRGEQMQRLRRFLKFGPGAVAANP
jgi:hypothetical protein